MTEDKPKILVNSGTVVTASSQTLAVVTGHNDTGNGVSRISTEHVDLSKGQIIRFKDGYEINFKLEMEPFLREGEPATLLYNGDRLIGAAKLTTGQWRANLQFGTAGISVSDSCFRIASFLSVYFLPVFFFQMMGWVGIPFGVLAAIGAFAATVIIHRNLKKEVWAQNKAAIEAVIEAERKKWADRIAEPQIGPGDRAIA